MVRCPECGSGSVKKSSAIYEQGISRSQGRSGGFWYSRGGPGVWSGRSSSERISGAAARNAPTGFELEAFTFVGAFAAALLLGFFTADGIGSFVLAVPIAFVVAGIAAFAVGVSQKEQRAASQARYDRQWYCSKCGHKFEVDLGQARPGAAGNPANVGPSSGSGSGGYRADFAARILNPVQRAKSETERDGTWLKTIAARVNGNDRSFDPCRPTALDLGAVSRLASLGYLRYDQGGDVFSLSDRGAARVAEMAS
jgi:rubredoxin